jgi:hypothetical protein
VKFSEMNAPRKKNGRIVQLSNMIFVVLAAANLKITIS